MDGKREIRLGIREIILFEEESDECLLCMFFFKIEVIAVGSEFIESMHKNEICVRGGGALWQVIWKRWLLGLKWKI